MSKLKTFIRTKLTAVFLAVCIIALPIAAPIASVNAAQKPDAFMVFFIQTVLPLLMQIQTLCAAINGGTQSTLPRMGISAGHGGNTGAYANGVWEDVKTLEVALAVNKEFNARGYTTLMNRTDNAKCDKETKLALYKAWNPDILLEFHYNIGTGKSEGLEVWYDSGNANGKRLAELLADKLSAVVGLKNRGAKGDDNSPLGGFYVCGSFPLGVLVECAFLDNPNDVKKLDSTAAREKFVKATVDAVAEFSAGK